MKSLSIIIMLLLACVGRNNDQENHALAEDDFRVLGYLFSYSNWRLGYHTTDFSKFTDINLAFIQPDHTGKIERDDIFHFIVKKAKENQTRVYISIGGGGPPEYLGEFLTPEKRQVWIDEIMAFTTEYDFDGVDVDLENALINEHYPAFVKELSDRLKSEGKLMTAALASWNGDNIADETLALYDYINIMSYDKTGPWNLDKPGQHSPYSMVGEDFEYYHVKRGVPADKLLIGLPFYGYGFGPGAPGSLRYHQIISTYPDAHLGDEISFPEGGTLYYNGPQLIRRKAEFAREKGAAGVMIWHIQADGAGEHSLLEAIWDVARQK
ncbi:glycosyl hydrolase family 18 protein [Negadavirga shengliensis]|uniref:chitinase n=1 Tax=Negadavirga shengliensis TaxID=1389218 RepID=A0ABV9T7T3_9BACT